MNKQEKSLRQSFVYYTECQLATLEAIRERKSSSKSDLRRHKVIADGMLGTMIEFGVTDDEMKQCPRVHEAVKSYPRWW